MLERLQSKQATWVAGYFDPLLAEHVRILQANTSPGKQLIVEIANPAHPYLPERARAELVAALSFVNHVVIANDNPDEVIDAGVTERFEQHVRLRHNGEHPQ